MQNKQALESKLDIQLIYGKGRKFLIMDQQKNRNMINILKHGEKLVKQLQSIPFKNGQIYSKYHRLFKILKQKACSELVSLGEEANDMAQALKKSLNQLIDELAAKARRYEEGEKKIKQLGRMHVQAEQEQEEQDERIKEEMLELMQVFKNHATEIGHDLKRDSGVIEDIGKKQDTVLSNLQRENSVMKDMAKNSNLGIFKLISMGCIAAVVWIFMMFFIVIF